MRPIGIESNVESRENELHKNFSEGIKIWRLE
jgi:hypothetical protein